MDLVEQAIQEIGEVKTKKVKGKTIKSSPFLYILSNELGYGAKMKKSVYHIGTKAFSSFREADNFAKEVKFKDYVIVSKGGGYSPISFFIAIKQRV